MLRFCGAAVRPRGQAKVKGSKGWRLEVRGETVLRCCSLAVLQLKEGAEVEKEKVLQCCGQKEGVAVLRFCGAAVKAETLGRRQGCILDSSGFENLGTGIHS